MKHHATESYRIKSYLLFLFIFLFIPLVSCGPKPIPAGSPMESNIIKPGITSPLLQYTSTLNQHKKNKVALIDVGKEALLLRIHLIRAARQSISMQTIIWMNDETGRLLMYEMIQAAKRGVKVQLLIDHFVSEKHPEVATFLATVHPNLEIKLYNPIIGQFSQHKINPTVFDQMTKLLSGFNKINQRMHNKVFIVDDHIGITGGRNNQNAYYDQAKGMNYRDRDVMVSGPVIEDMRKSFDEFWSFKYSISIKDLINWETVKEKGKLKIWSTKEDFVFNGLFKELFVDADNQQIIYDLFASRLNYVDDAYFIADNPGKNSKKFFGKFYGSGKITRELAQLVSNARL